MNFVSEIQLKSVAPLEARLNRTEGVFLTLDLDWCHEEILLDTLELLEEYEAKATFFCTDRPKSLDLLRGNSRVELGVHPNFRPLLAGINGQKLDAANVLDKLLELIPEAKSVRSHSLIAGSTLSSLFASRGLTHESNIRVPLLQGWGLRPFANFSGLVSCPFNWADYTDMGSPIPEKKESLYMMVAFHPIHIFLNSESHSRYEASRPVHYSPKKLLAHRNPGLGVRDEFIQFLRSN